MKRLNDQLIIGVDHGYGNIKTANHCFKTGILGYDSEPLFTGDMLTHGGRYYLIGEGHKEFIAEKIKDEDYYLLTLVAIAKELKDAELTEANIVLAAGLPLTWTSGQKKEFAAYLSKNKEVEFNYKKVDYHITIDDVRIYPQGYAAILRYIRLTNLIPSVLQKVDEGRIALTPAVELSYLTEWEQRDLLETMESEDCTPSLSQAIQMKALSQIGRAHV